MNGLLRFLKIVYFRHRNSQKRIIFKDACYFTTSKTHYNYPYFRERIFCDLFVENLRICKQLKGFLLYGWVLNYDHFHLLIQPNDKWDISDVMQFLKRNVSRNINFIMGYNENDEQNLFKIDGTPPSSEGDNDHCRLPSEVGLDIVQHIKIKLLLKFRFKIKYLNNNPYPLFKWQKSFFDEYMRNENEFNNFLDYIDYNPTKHHLPKNWPYIYTNPEYEGLNDEIL